MRAHTAVASLVLVVHAGYALAAPPVTASHQLHQLDAPVSLRLLSGQAKTVVLRGANALSTTSVRVLDSRGRPATGVKATLTPLNRQTNSRSIALHAANLLPGEYQLVLGTRDPAKSQAIRIVVKANRTGTTAPGGVARAPIQARTSPALAATPALRQNMLQRQQVEQLRTPRFVTEPGPGTQWQLGTAIQVRWNPGALAAQSVHVTLVPSELASSSDDPLEVISRSISLGHSVPNNGALAIPLLYYSVSPGAYVVRIRDTDDSESYLDSGSMSVVLPPCETGPQILRCIPVYVKSPLTQHWFSDIRLGTWQKGIKIQKVRTHKYYSENGTNVAAWVLQSGPPSSPTGDPIWVDVKIDYQTGGYSHEHGCHSWTICIPHTHHGVVVANIYIEGQYNQ